MGKYLLVLSVFLVGFNVQSQETPFTISLEPIIIENLGGLQSYAFGQADGKILVVGGRLDGLHRRQPWATFDIAGHNTKLWVIDPQAKESWSVDMTNFPSSIQEPLSATNMEFYQEGDMLYCIGGYGYSPTADDHITFNTLTAIEVSKVVQAIIDEEDVTPYIRQINDEHFRVSGGRLRKIDDQFYLLGGQKFMGRYNPMGPDHGPGFIQEYTNAIRIFTINDDGIDLEVNHDESYADLENLHRRDYNAESQIMPDGSEGITMFSGVFQISVDLPYLNSVNVTAEGYQVNNDFQQYYNHYHCPVLPIYSAENNEMHNVFFGGIAQYYDDNGVLVQDNNVPFVNTIARVTRKGDGSMAEYKMPVEMPDLLGAGAEFIPNEALVTYKNGVLNLDEISGDSTLVGYIYGGIHSSAPNIFFINEGEESIASATVYKVWLKKSNVTSTDRLNEAGLSTLRPIIYPNPATDDLRISFNMNRANMVKFTISDLQGHSLLSMERSELTTGRNVVLLNVDQLMSGIYLITIEAGKQKYAQKLVLER